MNVRKTLTGLVLGASILTLAACGQTPKEKVISSSKTVLDAEKVDFTTTLSLDVKMDSKKYTKEDQQAADVFKKGSITMDVKSDKKALKEEATIGFSFKDGENGMSVKMPTFVDMKANKAYLKADDLSFLSLLDPSLDEFLSPYEGKTLELDMNDPTLKEGFGLQTTLKDSVDSQKTLSKALIESLEGLPEEQFTKKEKVFQAELSGKDLKTVVTDLVDVIADATPELTKEDKEMAKEELKNLDFSKAKAVVSYTFDGKQLKSQKMVLTLDLKEEGMVIKLTANTVFKSIDKPVTFSFDTKKNIVTTPELIEAFQAFNEEMMMEEDYYDVGEEDYYFEEDQEATHEPFVETVQ